MLQFLTNRIHRRSLPPAALCLEIQIALTRLEQYQIVQIESPSSVVIDSERVRLRVYRQYGRVWCWGYRRDRPKELIEGSFSESCGWQSRIRTYSERTYEMMKPSLSNLDSASLPPPRSRT